jgi:hypothetical protein
MPSQMTQKNQKRESKIVGFWGICDLNIDFYQSEYQLGSKLITVKPIHWNWTTQNLNEIKDALF